MNMQEQQFLNRAIVARPLDGIWFDVVPGESATIRVHSDMVGGRYTIMEHTITPQSGPPLHSHIEEEFFEVLDGVMTFLCAGDQFEASAGTIVIIPAGAQHSWANLSGKPARMRTMFTPGSIEKLFTKLDGLSPDQFVALAQSYGTKVLGPGLIV